MPRFNDAWVVDKVMYTYVCNNGSASCLCCGAGTSGGGGSSEQQLFLFSDGSGFEGIVNAMSDLETREDKDHEIHAANVSPWPSELRDRIWSDRLSLRFKMKRERKIYRAFFERVLRDDEYENGRDHHHHLDNGNAVENEINTSSSTQHEINIQKAIIPILRKFCETELTPTQLQQIFQPLSTSSLVEMVKTKYKIGPAFAEVLCSVEDQVANFKITGYGADAGGGGRSSFVDEDDANNYYSYYEKQFEEQLHFTNKGFHLNIVKQVGHHRRDVAQEQWSIHNAVLLTFLRYMTCFASRTALLSRSVVRINGPQLDAADGEKVVEETEISHNTNNIILSNPIPSFRSDRRVIRLLIARYWADRLIEKYDEVQKEKK